MFLFLYFFKINFLTKIRILKATNKKSKLNKLFNLEYDLIVVYGVNTGFLRALPFFSYANKKIDFFIDNGNSNFASQVLTLDEFLKIDHSGKKILFISTALNLKTFNSIKTSLLKKKILLIIS